MNDFAEARRKMVESQIMTEDVTDYDVLRAMGEVPRERFVPAKLRPLAYIDEDLLLTDGSRDFPRYLMRPAPFARLLQLAEIGPTEKVLDVGCGTGYSTAVHSRLAARVVGLESDGELAVFANENLAAFGIANAAIVTGLLEAGYASEGPYDVIVLEGAVEFVPEALFAQLANGGRLVGIVGRGRAAPAMIYTRDADGDVGARAAFDAYARPLPGFERPKVFVF
jgi:protein-L-isoaspartate(D-aspartate) O-methyltransferase